VKKETSRYESAAFAAGISFLGAAVCLLLALAEWIVR